MPKFQAMMDMLHLVVPYIERDDKGQVVRDQSIIFNPGIKVGKTKVVPASLSVSDPTTLKYMRAYGGNEANGGTSFRELAEKKSEPVKAVSKAEPKAKSPEPAKEVVEEDETDVDISQKVDHPEVTTVQAAGNILKGLFSELTSRDVSNKDKVLAIAESKNISFSNLK